jgi:hypothetical protein
MPPTYADIRRQFSIKEGLAKSQMLALLADVAYARENRKAQDRLL